MLFRLSLALEVSCLFHCYKSLMVFCRNSDDYLIREGERERWRTRDRGRGEKWREEREGWRERAHYEWKSISEEKPFLFLHSNCTAALTEELRWVKLCFDLSVTGQSEDGADQDSPEEGTPASPRNKRRVGRPGRKRKQLLPVSTAIPGWRQPFKLSSDSSKCIEHTHTAFHPTPSLSHTQR